MTPLPLLLLLLLLPLLLLLCVITFWHTFGQAMALNSSLLHSVMSYPPQLPWQRHKMAQPSGLVICVLWRPYKHHLHHLPPTIFFSCSWKFKVTCVSLHGMMRHGGEGLLMGSRRETGEKTEWGYVDRGAGEGTDTGQQRCCYQQLTSCICGDHECSVERRGGRNPDFTSR